MNKLSLAVLAGAVVAGLAGTCAAQDTDTQSVQVSGKARYKPAPHEFDYGPAYRLETGEILTVRQEGRRYFTQLGDDPEVEVLPQAHGVYATRTGAKIRFINSGESVGVTDVDQLHMASAAALRERELAKK